MIKDIFNAVSRKMQIDFEEISKLIQHNGEKGTAREKILEDVLRSYIPEKYCFSKGTIIDSKDVQSKQVDIIIHDKFLTPYLIDNAGTKVVPIESVYGTIEVKSILTKEELKKCVCNIESAKKLKKAPISNIVYPTAGLVFAYDSDSSLETIYRNFNEISSSVDVKNRINCICVLNKGVIAPIEKKGLNTVSLFPADNTVYGIFNNPNDALLLFYLILFQILNSIVISPPDMVAYAQSSGMLDTTFSIPAGYIPDDGIYIFEDKSISVSEVNKVQKYAEKLLGGKLEEEDFLECFFGIYIPSLTMNRVPLMDNRDFLGVSISVKKIFDEYNKYIDQENNTDNETKELKEFRDYLYSIYANHKEEMKIDNSKYTINI